MGRGWGTYRLCICEGKRNCKRRETDGRLLKLVYYLVSGPRWTSGVKKDPEVGMAHRHFFVTLFASYSQRLICSTLPPGAEDMGGRPFSTGEL